MKKKLNLADLKISSFLVSLNSTAGKTILGGAKAKAQTPKHSTCPATCDERNILDTGSPCMSDAGGNCRKPAAPVK